MRKHKSEIGICQERHEPRQETRKPFCGKVCLVHSIFTSMKKETLTAKGSDLCLACGLCCKGVFFANTMNPEDYGVHLLRRRVTPSCLLHVDNKCLIYEHPRKSSLCSDYQCHLLKQLRDDVITLESAMRIVAEIVRLYERVAESLRLDSSKPVIKLALEAWENRKEEVSAGRLSKDQVLDIFSFMRLVDQYLKPNKPGHFFHGFRPRRA